jgi:glycosyltransferase involved in cell wall biosynthesis
MNFPDPTAGRPIRALLLLSQTYADGGIQRFNRTFLAACDRLNVRCEVLSLGDPESARSRWQEPGSVCIQVFDGKRVAYALAAGAAIVRGNFDFLIVGHVNLLQLAATVLTCRPHLRAKVLLVTHGIEVWTGMSGLRRRRAFKVVDRILSVSHYTRSRIREQIPALGDDQFFIFPNALSESWEQHSAPGRLADLDVGPRERFFLSVTRLDRGDRYKGVVTVIESLAMLADKTVQYIVAGRGEDLGFLRQVAARAGVSDRVHFVGAVTDAQLVSLYRRCAAFVLPSGKEGFGIVFLEAMFFGAPVIAAREKGAVDVVRDEETGLLVSYGDTVNLSATMERVLSDASLCERLRAAGRASVVGEGAFTFQAYVRRLATALDVSGPVAA